MRGAFYVFYFAHLFVQAADVQVEAVMQDVFRSVRDRVPASVEYFFWAMKGLLHRQKSHSSLSMSFELLGDLISGRLDSFDENSSRSLIDQLGVLFHNYPCVFGETKGFSLWRQKLFAALFPRVQIVCTFNQEELYRCPQQVWNSLVLFCHMIGTFDPVITLSSQPNAVIGILIFTINFIMQQRSSKLSALPKLQHLTVQAISVCLSSNGEAAKLLIDSLDKVIAFLEEVS